MTLGPVASIKSRNQNSEYVGKGWYVQNLDLGATYVLVFFVDYIE